MYSMYKNFIYCRFLKKMYEYQTKAALPSYFLYKPKTSQKYLIKTKKICVILTFFIYPASESLICFIFFIPSCSLKCPPPSTPSSMQRFLQFTHRKFCQQISIGYKVCEIFYMTMDIHNTFLPKSIKNGHMRRTISAPFFFAEISHKFNQ